MAGITDTDAAPFLDEIEDNLAMRAAISRKC